jgi:methylenetetrahydrofolate/methylenetetrahydromethanopterin dehydrogenase (NADP+)
LQLDTSSQPSVFDRIVAYDAGADEVMSYGGVTADTVRDLVHGAIFTRGPKDLRHTAIFIGGSDMAAGERLLAAVRKAFFGPLRVSVMLDSNGANTTAVAAVGKVQPQIGDLRGRRVVVTGAGPVGVRAASLMAREAADVAITSPWADQRDQAVAAIQERAGASVRAVMLSESAQATAALADAELLLNAGPAGTLVVPRSAWMGRAGLRVAADLNAVPPAGVEGIEVMDDGVDRDGVSTFGAIAIGNLKMKIHKACISRLFEQNDLVLDVETIADIGRTLLT